MTSRLVTQCSSLVVLAGMLTHARGQEASAEDTSLAVPEFMRFKQPMPDELLKDKRADTFFTGFPAIGYDPESKFTFGALAQFYDNGPKDSPFFAYAPYRERIAVGATASTGGNARAFLGYDRPYVGDTAWRIRAAALFGVTSFENYFGTGESTLGPLTYPGSTQEFGNFDDYTHALNQNVNGQTWARYNNYRRTEGRGVFTVERDYLGGRLRPQIGLQISHIGVEDYTGQEIDGAIQQETRLRTDDLAGKVVGFDGGWDNALKIGLTYDTREFEPDPAEGMMLQATARLSMQALGSAFNYQQFTFSGRGFQNLLRDEGRLVLAGRLAYAMQFGNVPFYSAPIISLTDGDVTGLGGFNTLRGFVQNHFVGDVAAYANTELRWTMGETMFKGQHLRFMLVPFVDTGRVFDSVGATTLNDWKFGGGFGFRLAWNVATIVSFDYGVSSEGSLFYMELGHQF
jgi:outer membrane translocation and assembly module TamA